MDVQYSNLIYGYPYFKFKRVLNQFIKLMSIYQPEYCISRNQIIINQLRMSINLLWISTNQFKDIQKAGCRLITGYPHIKLMTSNIQSDIHKSNHGNQKAGSKFGYIHQILFITLFFGVQALHVFHVSYLNHIV